MHYERDEFAQGFPNYTPEAPASGNQWTKRTTKGNRKAQAKRYHLKAKARRREYKRRYMREYMKKRRLAALHPV